MQNTSRAMNTSPLPSPMMRLAGTRASEHPIHRIDGDCPLAYAVAAVAVGVR